MPLAMCAVVLRKGQYGSLYHQLGLGNYRGQHANKLGPNLKAGLLYCLTLTPCELNRPQPLQTCEDPTLIIIIIIISKGRVMSSD